MRHVELESVGETTETFETKSPPEYKEYLEGEVDAPTGVPIQLEFDFEFT
ncbi:hypothetical protein [Vibrio harveyi]|nr:hypothetical protein [Vibrio harveyi]